MVSDQGFENLKHFAKKKGLNRNTLHSYLRGQPVFTRQFLRITEALNCNPIDLIETFGSEKEFDIPANIINIAMLIKEINPLVAVFLFGSRLTNNHHPHADWDLGLTHARKSLTTAQFFHLKNHIEPVIDNFTEQVDLVNLDEAPEWFLKDIVNRPVFIRGSELARVRFLKKWESVYEK